MSKPFIRLAGRNRRAVVAIAMSGDGKHIVVAKQKKYVELWNLEGHLLESHSRHRKQIDQLAVSDDAAVIVSLTERTKGKDYLEELFHWNRHNKTIRQIPPELDTVLSLAFIPKEQLLVAVFERNLTIYNAMGKQTGNIPFDSDLQAVATSSDGNLLALASEDGDIHLWDVAKGAIIKTLHGHSQAADKLAFSKDRAFLGSTSWDETFRIWDVATGEEVRCASAPCKALFHLGYLAEQDAWLIVDRKHGLRVFGKHEKKDLTAELPNRLFVSAVASHSDQGLIAIGDAYGTVDIWRTSALLENAYLSTGVADELSSRISEVSEQPLIETWLDAWEGEANGSTGPDIDDFIERHCQEADQALVDCFRQLSTRLVRANQVMELFESDT